MEFIDGSEVTPGHSTLAALKRDRIAQRLLANFGFTDVQRSLDGAQYVLNMPKFNVTAVAARPTEGVFQVDGYHCVLTDSRQVRPGVPALDMRLSSGVVKTDNRPALKR
jgi:hypothetical protein